MPPKARPPLTHFLCLPLATPQSLPALTASLQQLADDVSRPANEPPAADAAAGSDQYAGQLPRLPAAAVRPPTTLHLTLGVLSLDAARLDAARAHLRALDVRRLLRQAEPARDGAGPEAEPGEAPLASPPPPLVVRLQGLTALRKPASTTVVFAEPVDASGRLARFCGGVRQSFADAALLLPDRELLLHATLVNTIYAPRGAKHAAAQEPGAGEGERRDMAPAEEAAQTGAGSAEEGPEAGVVSQPGPAPKKKGRRRFKAKPMTFDARGLCEKWGEALWAEIRLETLAICEMGAKASEDGMVRYAEVESRELP